VLEHAAVAIADPDRTILREQIAQVDLVQRFNSDRMVVVFFANREGVSSLADQRPDNVIVTLVARSGGRALGQVDVVSHRGRVHSLEFTKSPKDWGDDVRLTEATRSSTPTLAAEVDASEHGAPDA